VESTAGYVAVQEALRKEERLLRLALELYPELDGQPAPQEDPVQRQARQSAELHVIAQMFQVMENAWLSLNLDVNYAHPLNRGWMDVFHRWTSAGTVRRVWPVLRSEFARDFINFCEKQMRMAVVRGRARPIAREAAADQHLSRLEQEFHAQWPLLEPTLGERVRTALQQTPSLAWFIFPQVDPPANHGPAIGQDIPCGVILCEPRGGADGGRPDAELFIWLRGAYRNTGLGRTALRQVLDEELPAVWPAGFRLHVYLPVSSLVGPGGELQKAMWMTFFHHFEFVRAAAAEAPPTRWQKAAGAAPEQYEVLRRDFGPRQPAPPQPQISSA
jgi:hypothetical protein